MLVHNVFAQANRLEGLRTVVAAQRRNAEFRQDFKYTLVDVDVIVPLGNGLLHAIGLGPAKGREFCAKPSSNWAIP